MLRNEFNRKYYSDSSIILSVQTCLKWKNSIKSEEVIKALDFYEVNLWKFVSKLFNITGKLLNGKKAPIEMIRLKYFTVSFQMCQNTQGRFENSSGFVFSKPEDVLLPKRGRKGNLQRI